MRALLITFFALIILVACSSEKKQIQSWSQWRGPNINSTIIDEGFNPAMLDSSNITWIKNVGFGHSAISTSGKYCYTSGWKEVANETDTVAASTVYCLDIETGNEVWSFTYPAAKRSYPGPRSTPVISENRVYSLGWEGKLFCLDSQSGEEVWSVDLAADSITTVDQWGFCPSPVVYNNLLLFNLNKTGLAIDKNNGKVVWSGEYGNSSWASAYLLEVEGKMHGVFQSDSNLFLVDVENGNVVSSYSKKSTNGINNDVELIGQNELYASDELLSINSTNIESVWDNDSIASFFRTGVIVNGYAYQYSDVKRKNYLYCVDVKTGKPMWRETMDGRWGNLSAVNEYLIVFTSLGKIQIAKASPEKYEVINELQILSAENNQDNFCWVSPTFVNGNLFIRNSKGELACIKLVE